MPKISVNQSTGCSVPKTDPNKEVETHVLLTKVAGPQGIEVKDRKWHLKTYKECFVGIFFHSFKKCNAENTQTYVVQERNLLIGFCSMKPGLVIEKLVRI